MNDKCARSAIAASLPPFESDVHIVQRIADADAVATIAVLTWFDDPHVLLLTILLLQMLEAAVASQKVFVLGVVNSFDQVECEG